jgi:signal transduction histidine kinase/DNA-binding response OmpR family regulator
MFNRLKLGQKFTLLMLVAFMMGILLSGVTLWYTIQHQAEADIAIQAELLTQTMNSVRRYTSTHIEPLLQSQLRTEPEFVRETVPSFAARAVFEKFRSQPEYSSFFYKEATPNPTNPENRADEFEENLFAAFRASPKLKVVSGYHTASNKRLYYISRPLRVQESSCLECHLTPSRAPKSQIATYGDQSGFGWRLGDVIAAQTIYVPAGEVFEQGWRYMSLVMGIFSAISAIGILLINRVLKSYVVNPLKQLTKIARRLSQDSITPELVQSFETYPILRVTQRQDEPGQLARTFHHMAREVAERETKLNLAVAERTAQLAERTQEAQAANKAKSRFLAHMSHELRTPLNIILGFSQLMTRQRSLDKTQKEYLNTINQSGEHLLGLINSVLDLAKIEAGKITLNSSNFDLNGMLDILQGMFQIEADVKGLQFIIERPDTLPYQICTDERKLRQVLINLVSNAVKFTAAGQITLRIKIEQNHTLSFEIADTGAGIAPAELEQLFQPFIQTESGRQIQEGTGLGLAIACQFVQLMGGQLTARSTVGSGTTFYFAINAPFIDDNGSQQVYSPQRVIGLAPGQPIYRILVVDDVAENRKLLVELLQPIGFEVQQASNGQEAIAISQSWLPHLIWMDIFMPDIDGYTATQHIKSTSTPAPVVIALTGSIFTDDHEGIREEYFDDFVRKPFRAEVIFEKMAIHLRIQYDYAPDEGEVHTLLQDLSLADLSTMSPDWLNKLNQAATRVNSKELLALIGQIPAEHASLIRTLTQKVQNFQFTDIKTMTE